MIVFSVGWRDGIFNRCVVSVQSISTFLAFEVWLACGASAAFYSFFEKNLFKIDLLRYSLELVNEIICCSGVRGCVFAAESFIVLWPQLLFELIA